MFLASLSISAKQEGHVKSLRSLLVQRIHGFKHVFGFSVVF